MARSPFRARLATIALAIVTVCVVADFIWADRAIVRAERDKAALAAAHAAALAESFLHTRAAAIGALQFADTLDARAEARGDTLAVLGRFERAVRTLRAGSPGLDALWYIDTSGVVRAAAALVPGAVLPSVGKPAEWLPTDGTSDASRDLVDSSAVSQVSVVVLRREAERRSLVAFVRPMSRPDAGAVLLVGTVAGDSLASLLTRREVGDGFGVALITSTADTVVDLLGNRGEERTERTPGTVRLPGGPTWTAVVNYQPSQRGPRVALWTIALGALASLAVGLLLERREARRIADRSSELEHLSTELLRANRAKSEFLANVSHELRTPLNAIVGFVDLLRDGVYGELNLRQVGPVERIEASANHLRHLVDQILDLAKMAAGRLEVHTEPLDLRPFVFDVASEVEPLITEKGLSFSLAVGATLPRVRTDPTHLRQILVNLLGNAVKFTSTGGISVRGKLVGAAEEAGRPTPTAVSPALRARAPKPGAVWVALQVADSGIGIPEKDRERIFDEFEQVNAGPRGDSMRRGTGLGLSISRRLARLIGGDITVESELGKGSVFTIWIPVDPADLRGDRAA